MSLCASGFTFDSIGPRHQFHDLMLYPKAGKEQAMLLSNA